jgi:hypothetical protein
MLPKQERWGNTRGRNNLTWLELRDAYTPVIRTNLVASNQEGIKSDASPFKSKPSQGSVILVHSSQHVSYTDVAMQHFFYI